MGKKKKPCNSNTEPSGHNGNSCHGDYTNYTLGNE